MGILIQASCPKKVTITVEIVNYSGQHFTHKKSALSDEQAVILTTKKVILF